MRFSASDLTTHLGAELSGPDVSVEGASIDSRTIRVGQLYVPIVAERDGHAFIPAALEAGAAAYLTAQEPLGGDGDPCPRHRRRTVEPREVCRAVVSAARSGSPGPWAKPPPRTSWLVV